MRVFYKEKWEKWQNIKDTVPNLQLMEGRENSSKNATLFKEWFEGTDGSGKKNVSDPIKFKEDNFYSKHRISILTILRSFTQNEKN